MTTQHSLDIQVFPDDCDFSGRVSSSAFIRLFERGRWDAIARGPGLNVFMEQGLWPAMRKSAVDFYDTADAGEVLTIDTALTHHGDTSFTLHQRARRVGNGALVAEGDFLFVCLDESGEPSKVPPGIARFFGTRPSVRPGETQHLAVRGVATAVDIEGDGPAVLFVHGFPLDRTMWRHLMATLTGWQRIAPDLRGMGLSDVPDRDYTMAEYADDLAGLLDVLRVENAVVCGLSMGGYIAFEMFRRHPDRVRALVLANTRADADSADGRRARDDMIDLVDTKGVTALADRMVPKLLGPSSLSAMPRVVEHLRTMISSTPPRGVTGALAAMRDRQNSTDLLPQIGIPTLVVAGRDDLIVPIKKSRQMADKIPGAQFTMIPEAGHLTPLEQPIALSRVIGEFLDALL